MTGPLDLSDANLDGFKPLDPARYNAEIFEVSWAATNNPEGKMPVGTPMMKVQFKLVDEPNENRRVFTQFVIPPKDYDPKKRATMTGMLVRFFIELGFKEEDVKKAKFMDNLDFEDLKGMPCVVILGKEPKKDSNGIIEGEFNNPVKGIKKAGSLTGGSTSGGGLL